MVNLNEIEDKLYNLGYWIEYQSNEIIKIVDDECDILFIDIKDKTISHYLEYTHDHSPISFDLLKIIYEIINKLEVYNGKCNNK